MRAGAEIVLVIGGRGEFGRFLAAEILPRLGGCAVHTTDRDTPAAAANASVQAARHIVLATPLAGYAERADELVLRCRAIQSPKTLWLIPSVHAGVWRTVTSRLRAIGNPFLSVVLVHPMYGPNGFRAMDPAAGTFRNILTACHDTPKQPLDDEVAWVADTFRRIWGIETTRNFDPDEHDRVTARSQGLSYCVATLMFEDGDLDAAVREHLPDLWRSFHADRDLIRDYLHANEHVADVYEAFSGSWARAARTGYDDLLDAFAEADSALHSDGESPIPTKWYERLRRASQQQRPDRPARPAT